MQVYSLQIARRPPLLCTLNGCYLLQDGGVQEPGDHWSFGASGRVKKPIINQYIRPSINQIAINSIQFHSKSKKCTLAKRLSWEMYSNLKLIQYFTRVQKTAICITEHWYFTLYIKISKLYMYIYIWIIQNRLNVCNTYFKHFVNDLKMCSKQLVHNKSLINSFVFTGFQLLFLF